MRLKLLPLLLTVGLASLTAQAAVTDQMIATMPRPPVTCCPGASAPKANVTPRSSKSTPRPSTSWSRLGLSPSGVKSSVVKNLSR